MPRQLTITLKDEALFDALQEESTRRGRPAPDIVAEAVEEWLAAREDEALQDDINRAREAWKQAGGVEAGEFFGRRRENTYRM